MRGALLLGGLKGWPRRHEYALHLNCWMTGDPWIESKPLLRGESWLEKGATGDGRNGDICLPFSTEAGLAPLKCGSALLKGVDCLPMAKPVATIHSEIRRDCCRPFSLGKPVAGSLL